MNDDSNSDNNLEILNKIIQLLQPLPEDQRERLARTLLTFFGIDYADPRRARSASHHAEASTSSRVPYSQDLSITPKQFLIEKQPRTDVERLACLAYFLTHYRDMPHFKTIDLNKLNTEAAQPKLTNAAGATKNAVTYGYLAQATKGQRQLSAAGEQFVSLLPDRQAARAAMTSLIKRRRAKSRKSAKMASEANNGE